MKIVQEYTHKKISTG